MAGRAGNPRGNPEPTRLMDRRRTPVAAINQEKITMRPRENLLHVRRTPSGRPSGQRILIEHGGLPSTAPELIGVPVVYGRHRTPAGGEVPLEVVAMVVVLDLEHDAEGVLQGRQSTSRKRWGGEKGTVEDESLNQTKKGKRRIEGSRGEGGPKEDAVGQD
ncbi:hypothetical protein G7046_g1959 [Stylonectria norvegica]|nr:hypothetical protein G7046_g1959 [Stylonectria norvegica]